MTSDASDALSAALAILALGFFQEWPYPWAIAAFILVAGLFPGWLRARKEQARTRRAGKLLITEESLQLTDDRGTANVPVDEIIDLDGTRSEGLEIFCRDGLTTTMEGRQAATALAVAEALRKGLGLGSNDLLPEPVPVSAGGRIEVADDEVGRTIHVTHGLLTAGGARRYARAMLVGAIGCAYLAATVVTNPAIWGFVIALIVGAALLMRPAKISRLRLRRDGTYMLESHDAVRSGKLDEIDEILVAGGGIELDSKPLDSRVSFQAQGVRDLAADFLTAAPHEDVVLDLEEEHEAAERVEEHERS